MSPARTLENNKYEVGENRTREPDFGGQKVPPPRPQSHVTM